MYDNYGYALAELINENSRKLDISYNFYFFDRAFLIEIYFLIQSL